MILVIANVMETKFLDISLKQYIISFGVIVAATALNFILKKIISVKAEKWVEKRLFLSSMFKLIIKPLRFLIIIIHVTCSQETHAMRLYGNI